MDLKTAAARLGVHYQTAYRWVREGSLSAMKIGPTYEVDPYEIERLLRQRSVPVPPPMRSRVRSWDMHLLRLYDALISGDERMARQVIERLRDGGQETVEICERLVTPALRRIGDAWAEGHVSLVEEHRASAMCTRLLAGISVHPRGRPRGVAVVTTVPGEAHELPGMMASMALRADRWQVHHLGTQVPYDQLAALVRRERATLVVLSVTHTRVQRDALHCAERVRRELGVRALTGRPGATLTDLIHGAKQAAAA